MIYACSILSSTSKDYKVINYHTAVKIDARNYSEALGIARQLADKFYPQENASVHVNIEDVIATSENLDKINLD